MDTLHRLISPELLAMLPLALATGKALRGRISEAGFRRVLLGFLLVIALMLLLK